MWSDPELDPVQNIPYLTWPKIPGSNRIQIYNTADRYVVFNIGPGDLGGETLL